MIPNKNNKIEFGQYSKISSLLFNSSNQTEQMTQLIEEYFNYLTQNNSPFSDSKAIFNSFSSFFTLILNYPTTAPNLSLSSLEWLSIEHIARVTAKNFRIKELDESNILIRYGENLNLFLLILRGEVEVLSPIVQEMQMHEKDYYRYLAYLMELREYELINRVLIENVSNYSLEISKTNNFGKIPKRYKADFKLPKYITLSQLSKELDAEEKKNLEIKNENNEFTIDDYLGLMENIKRDIPNRKDKVITVNVLVYKATKTLMSGDYFGYEGLIYGDIDKDKEKKRNKDQNKENDKGNNSSDKICSVYFTSKKTQFAYLTHDMFNETIMPIMKSMLEKDIEYLHSGLLFNDLSLSLFERKYYHLFNKKLIKKGHRLIKQNNTCDSIYFISPAEYQLTTEISIKELLEAIILLYKQYDLDDSDSVRQEILDIIKEDYRMEKKASKCPITKDFYFNKAEIRLFTITNEDLIGLNYLCANNNVYLFNVELKSSKGEYYEIKKDLYENIKENEPIVRQKDKKYNEKNASRVINRLIELWKLKVKLFYQHNKEIIKKLHQLAHPTVHLKKVFAIPKKTNQSNQFKERKYDRSSSMKIIRGPNIIDNSLPSCTILPFVDKSNRKKNSNNDSINNSYKEIKTKLWLNTNMYINSSPRNNDDANNKEPKSFKQMVFDSLMNKERQCFFRKKNNLKKVNRGNLTSLLDDNNQDTSLIHGDYNANASPMIINNAGLYSKSNIMNIKSSKYKKTQLNNELLQESLLCCNYKLKPILVRMKNVNVNTDKKCMFMNYKKQVLKKLKSQSSINVKDKNISLTIRHSGNKDDHSF